MSLDVYLILKGVQNLPSGPKIFIREDGQNKEISRKEWDLRYPDREPVTVEFASDDETVFDYNITHNLGRMADQAGLYSALWRPEEILISEARELIPFLEEGLLLLKSKPEFFREFNPDNGWGDYEGLVDFVEKYLEACKRYPDAEISVSR